MKKLFIILFMIFALSYVNENYAQSNTKKVNISFDYTKRPGYSSNQIAAWAEDNNGNYIATIYITDFTGRREGWTYRKQSLNNWQKKANAQSIDKNIIDAVSKPTPKQGKVNIVWDCKDNQGNVVKDGTYRIVVEATIYQDNNVLYTSVINIGNQANSQKASAKYSKPEAQKIDIIKNVNVSFMP
ncbi:DUF2271 domain-containing protein [Brachyspira pilosicoli]|uniref:DUF2271 domain-containing protein n=1 Tax=Brachyspira pilosicoli TaxID=52584 RepID=A0AAJ6KC50_BRAPL|nr:DUF2271 domain-containing protein [Brachyspira pilosicoli]WIH90766.1 DUF2271 domain-containing protein [Brachyspira pilosicoli]WIH93057.1 DUF2271 domain-containing protein [Brachyspira pilosicoli]WIH95346.1 DUF2271 domain-containing protein [Brachyspira pilosicoli]